MFRADLRAYRMMRECARDVSAPEIGFAREVRFEYYEKQCSGACITAHSHVYSGIETAFESGRRRTRKLIAAVAAHGEHDVV